MPSPAAQTQPPVAGPAAFRLDQPVKLLSAKLWAGFAALAIVVGAAVVWAFVATLPQHVSANGVILHGAAAVTPRAPAAGSLASVSVAPGTKVTVGQSLATLDSNGRELAVTAPTAGTVMSLLASPGQQLLPGAPILTIDPADQPARAVLFVSSPSTLLRLQAGQKVDLGGSVAGRVLSVTPYPASQADLVARFGTTDIPGVSTGDGPTWLVDVQLDGGAGSAPALTPVAASVLVDKTRPYQLVFGGHR